MTSIDIFSTIPIEIEEQLIHTIIRTFNYTKKQAKNLLEELLLCVKRRDLVRENSSSSNSSSQVLEFAR